MYLTIEDLKKLQTEHPDFQMELVEGKIIIMGPSDYLAEEVIAYTSQAARKLGCPSPSWSRHWLLSWLQTT